VFLQIDNTDEEMGLKAISNSKVGHMIDALDNLEMIRSQIGHENSDSHELQNLRIKLQDKHIRYKEMLINIEAEIKDFEVLYKTIKTRFLPEMLKELKQILPEDSQDFILVKEVIHKTYRQ